MGVNSPQIYSKAVVRRDLAGGGARSYMTSAMRNGGGGDVELCNHDTTIMGKG